MITVHDLTFEPFLTAEQIRARVRELGKELTQKYAHKNPILLGVLNGAFIFMADLARACDMTCEISFVKLHSYVGTSSSKTITTALGLELEIRNRHIIVVEDIVDSGRTMQYFLELLEQQQPASVTLVTLLFKPDALQVKLPIDYVGFTIPNHFVIGYGLDYDGLGRNLPDILRLKS